MIFTWAETRLDSEPTEEHRREKDNEGLLQQLSAQTAAGRAERCPAESVTLPRKGRQEGEIVRVAREQIEAQVRENREAENKPHSCASEKYCCYHDAGRDRECE